AETAQDAGSFGWIGHGGDQAQAAAARAGAPPPVEPCAPKASAGLVTCAPMAKTKLTYFDAPISRGEECRIALHLAGVDFEDVRIKPADWPALKPQTPYGGMPIFEVAGKPPIAHVNAILPLIGRMYG